MNTILKKIFPIVYSFLIISYFLIGQLSFFGTPLNFNIVSSLLTFTVCCTFEKPRCDKWMEFYLVFICFYLLSSIIMGGLGTLFHNLYSTFFISYTGYWATSILVRYYRTLTPLIYIVIFVGIIDTVVTVMQASGIPVTNPFLESLIQDTDQQMFIAMHEDMMGVSISGLFMNPVFNGHFLLFFMIVSLIPQYKKTNLIMLIFPTIIWIGLFFCQQRSAFFIATIILIFVLYKRLISNSKYKYLTIVGFSIFLIMSIIYLFSIIDSSGSRLNESSGTGREDVWLDAIRFFIMHPILGGYNLFLETTKVPPHNQILTAYLAGGIFGGSILMIMLFDQFRFMIMRILKKGYLMYYILFALYMAMILDSMLHNTGLVEMDFATFVTWGAFGSIMKNNKFLIRNKKKRRIKLIKRKKQQKAIINNNCV